LDLARKEYARIAPLVRKGAATREELDVWSAKIGTSTAERKQAQAAIEQAELDLAFTKVTAPFDGKASRTQVSVGTLVNAGGTETVLTTIVTVHPMYVYFDVPERALLRYRRDFRKGREEGGAEPSVKDLKIPVYVALEGEKGYPHK